MCTTPQGASYAAAPSEEVKVIHLIRGHDDLMTPFKKNAQIVLLIIAIILSLILGSTLAYFSAQDSKIRSVPLARIELSLAEVWDPATGIEYNAGLTAIKSPTITADAGSMYTRISMKVEESVSDGAGGVITRLITDPARLALIEGILYADVEDRLIPGTPYSALEISSTSGVSSLYDPAHFFAPSSPEPGLYYFEYYHGDSGIMIQGTSATLFNKVVIPTDYTQENLNLMGTFTITLEGQGIQSYGFTSQAQAMAELDKVVS